MSLLDESSVSRKDAITETTEQDSNTFLPGTENSAHKSDKQGWGRRPVLAKSNSHQGRVIVHGLNQKKGTLNG